MTVVTLRWSKLIVFACFLAGVPPSHAGESSQADLAFFESKVRPLLHQHCLECHGALNGRPKGGLRLDHREGVLAGGDGGEVVVRGEPSQSRLIQAVSYLDSDLRMPPDGRLPEEAILILVDWVQRGMPDPRELAEEMHEDAHVAESVPPLEHWAFQPLQALRIPGKQGLHPIDALLEADRTAQGLVAAPVAPLEVLIRRSFLDLTGLPPTEAELQEVLEDAGPGAWGRHVDRLLASPRFGEHFARKWLDLARYADSNGADENKAYSVAWRYRDYVIDAFNRDLPYDRFILEQLAGDLMEPEGDWEEANRLRSATGFLVLGPKMLAEQDKEKLVMDVVDEQLDVLGQTFLGLTLGCARCHDHKYDPVRQKDYYQLAGIFRSTRVMADTAHVSQWMERPLQDPKVEAAAASYRLELSELQGRLKILRSKGDLSLTADQLKLPGDKRDKLYPDSVQRALGEWKEKLKSLQSREPRLPVVMAVEEGASVDLQVHARGSHLNRIGKPLPRGVPEWSWLQGASASSFTPAEGSGRLEWARWLADPGNPLVYRVMANRVWNWVFGQGLVETPSDFGLKGSPPTHPELLDWLALRLRDQPSIKGLIREMLLTEAYQMDSRFPGTGQEEASLDKWYARRKLRRLTLEELRDSMLVASGGLDSTMGGSLVKLPERDYVRVEPGNPVYSTPRRTIYLPVIRARMDGMYEVFDFANPSAHVALRDDTITPRQALWLMNDPFTHHCAQRLVDGTRYLQTQPALRVSRLHRIVLSSTPATDFVEHWAARLRSARDQEWKLFMLALLSSNAHLYVR